MDTSNKLLNVAISSSCTVLQQGIEALLLDEKHQSYPLPHFSLLAEVEEFFSSRMPDVVVIDIHFYHTDVNGIIQLIESIKRVAPAVKIMIMLDVHVSCVIKRLLALGIHGLVKLNISIPEWNKVLQRVSQGKVWYCSCVDSTINQVEYKRRYSTPLNNSETSVLGYLLAGYSLANLAIMMSRAEKTLTNQKVSGMKKLGLKHYSQLIAVWEMLKTPLRIR